MLVDIDPAESLPNSMRTAQYSARGMRWRSEKIGELDAVLAGIF